MRRVSIRKLFIRSCTPIIWRFFPGRQTRALIEFSETEWDSGARMLQLANLDVPDEVRRFAFCHAIEEFQHARMFEAVAKQISPLPSINTYSERRFELDRASSSNEVARAYAYACWGEIVIAQEFSAYADATPLATARNAFRFASEDESTHADQTLLMLDLLLSNARLESREKALRRAKFDRLIEIWASFGRGFASINLHLILSIIYLALGALFRGSARSAVSNHRKNMLRFYHAQLKRLGLGSA
jgi:hypothetical protein